MKRIVILAIILLMALPLPGVLAQDVEQTITSDSQRYSMTAPGDWYVSNEPVIADLQGIFPAESVTIADSEASLAALAVPGEDPFGLETFSGAVIMTTVWPADLLEIVGLDVETFGTLVTLTADGDSTNEPATYETLTGSFTHVDNGSRSIIVGPLADKVGNMLLVVAYTDPDHAADVDAILETLEFRALSTGASRAGDLTVPVSLLPEVVDVKVPPGWWVMGTPDVTMAAPDFDGSFMEALETYDFTGVSGTFLLALTRDKTEFPQGVYAEDGSLQADALAELFDLASLMGINSTDTDFGEVEIVGDEWENSAGLSGVVLDMTAPEQNLVFRMIVLDNGVDLAVLMAFSTADNWEVYEETVNAIFDTAELVME